VFPSLVSFHHSDQGLAGQRQVHLFRDVLGRRQGFWSKTHGSLSKCTIRIFLTHRVYETTGK
jgi:hypothetical protein